MLFTDSAIQSCGLGLCGIVVAVGDSRVSYANRKGYVAGDDDEKEDEVLNA